MKRTKVIAWALCAAILLLGAGYAYWSDTLIINNTVATGELNVEFQNTGVTADPAGIAVIDWAKGSGDADDEIKHVAITVGNMYPGAMVGFRTSIANTGTIPALLKPIVFADQEAAILRNGTVLQQITTDAEKANLIIGGFVAYDGQIHPLEGVTFANISQLNALLPKSLPAGKSVTLDLTLTLNRNLTEGQLENRYINTVMTLNFKQHNEP